MPQKEWRYRLMFYEDEEGMRKIGELLLTKRLSGTGQLAYLPGKDLVVRLNQNIIDVLHPLLFNIEIPEEYQPPAPQDTSEPGVPVESGEVVPLENSVIE